MRASISLGRIAGVPIGLHYSWLIIATLITLSLAAHFRATNTDWLATTVWFAAIVTALLFFVALVAHELSHAVVARLYDLPVRSITLFALGGVAQIEREAQSAKAEFWIGVAGPITSVLIGLACLGAALGMGWTLEGGAPGITAAILGWLGSINIMLAVFNLLPGYPLDGGRVLRSILWAWWNDGDRATRGAATVGQVVAILFIFLGLLRFFAGGGFGGLWLAFIGWFLLDAARTSYSEVTLAASLRDVRAADVMATDCETVRTGTALENVVDRLLRTGRRCFIVEREDGAVAGLITPQEVRDIERERWPDVRVDEAMRPLQSLKTVSPATPVTEALRIMSREDLHQLPVVSDGHLEGVITRGHVLRLIQTRSELKA